MRHGRRWPTRTSSERVRPPPKGSIFKPLKTENRFAITAHAPLSLFSGDPPDARPPARRHKEVNGRERERERDDGLKVQKVGLGIMVAGRAYGPMSDIRPV